MQLHAKFLLPILTAWIGVVACAQNTHFITRNEPQFHCSQGLDGNIIAIWQSHGRYFEPKTNRWEWQRARLMQTVEDLYTQSYVLPFLIPMLERAGAYTISPRERDTSTVEVIVDSDGGLAQNGYNEINGKEKWHTDDGNGFAYLREYYTTGQNPFTDGTYRIIQSTEKEQNASYATYDASMPQAGTYAIYISYKSLPKSSDHVTYRVNSLAGTASFTVNQQMGSSTWIYLGHFPLAEGLNKGVVQVSNLCIGDNGKTIVTTDAIKIGGGMGNIARHIDDNADSDVKQANPISPLSISQYPRFTEAARYWLQWAGMPDSIYASTEDANDYTDDLRCRGLWVNYMAGSSPVLPNSDGLRIPIDIAFALHTDAGITTDDEIIGTLGIYCTEKNSRYANGTPRSVSRSLTDNIMTTVVSDIKALYEPQWTRREMWDKRYNEARVPQVPTTLLELLSHQNFADMRYGLDPSFRFTVSRAIYKGMLQFLANRDHRPYTVQPLPINSFAITPNGNNAFTLSWCPTTDTQCPSAKPSKYYIYERIGNSNSAAFSLRDSTTLTSYSISIDDNLIHSFQIEAANDGGRSFPSETLALAVVKNSKATVMIVNGFTRVSAPESFDLGEIAGFYDNIDHGVPYLYDISYIGQQYEFRRQIPWTNDDDPGFGASFADYETKVLPGNTFDYTALHGQHILQAGYSFVSASVKAVEDHTINLDLFPVVDIILGKQRTTTIGRGAVPQRYPAFSAELQQALTQYAANGGAILASGAYVASDLLSNQSDSSDAAKFASKTLGLGFRTSPATATAEVKAAANPFPQLQLKSANLMFFHELNDFSYCVETSDGLLPTQASGAVSYPFLQYSDTNIAAAVATQFTTHRSVAIGFPLETITRADSRQTLFNHILRFLLQP